MAQTKTSAHTKERLTILKCAQMENANVASVLKLVILALEVRETHKRAN